MESFVMLFFFSCLIDNSDHISCFVSPLSIVFNLSRVHVFQEMAAVSAFLQPGAPRPYPAHYMDTAIQTYRDICK